jgi:hypothetical protein
MRWRRSAREVERLVWTLATAVAASVVLIVIITHLPS